MIITDDLLDANEALSQSRVWRDPQFDNELSFNTFVKFSRIGIKLQPQINFQLSIYNFQLLIECAKELWKSKTPGLRLTYGRAGIHSAVRKKNPPTPQPYYLPIVIIADPDSRLNAVYIVVPAGSMAPGNGTLVEAHFQHLLP